MNLTHTKGHWKINLELYLLFLLPAVIVTFIFIYIPMWGAQIAFRDYLPTKGIWGSTWVGLRHFKRFINSFQFWNLLKNTLGISIYQLAAGFPLPIILALMLNQLKNGFFKKFTQTVTYAPHFISVVVLVGLLHVFLNPRNGLVNVLFMALGKNPVYFLGMQDFFWHLYVISGIWQSTGWAAILYLAALAAIDPQLYEAAKIDGATRLQRTTYIDIPGIMPTVVILFILNTGRLMNVGFEKTYLMQNPLNLGASEVISTYVYKVGLVQAQFGFASAVGLFNGVVNLILLFIVDRITKQMGSGGLL
ncbi:sugar ABC transporter permease [Spirochaetia bacterium]|nr:sugar ABC transporter permease [Spirochaetia bacterium]